MNDLNSQYWQAQITNAPCVYYGEYVCVVRWRGGLLPEEGVSCKEVGIKASGSKVFGIQSGVWDFSVG